MQRRKFQEEGTNDGELNEDTQQEEIPIQSDAITILFSSNNPGPGPGSILKASPMILTLISALTPWTNLKKSRKITKHRNCLLLHLSILSNISKRKVNIKDMC